MLLLHHFTRWYAASKPSRLSVTNVVVALCVTFDAPPKAAALPQKHVQQHVLHVPVAAQLWHEAHVSWLLGCAVKSETQW